MTCQLIAWYASSSRRQRVSTIARQPRIAVTRIGIMPSAASTTTAARMPRTKGALWRSDTPGTSSRTMKFSSFLRERIWDSCAYQERISEAERDGIELLLDGFSPALNSQDESFVAVAKIEVLERVSDEVGSRRDQSLNEPKILGLEGFVPQLELGIELQFR